MVRRCSVCRKVIGPHDPFLADNTRAHQLPVVKGMLAGTTWEYTHTWCIEPNRRRVIDVVNQFIERIKVVGIQLKLAELRKRPGYKGDRWQK